MAERQSYTEVLTDIKVELSSLRTISEYQENHLGNIDSHLNLLNERTGKTERGTDRNSDRISIIWKVGGWVGGSIFGGGVITAIVLKWLGFF